KKARSDALSVDNQAATASTSNPQQRGRQLERRAMVESPLAIAVPSPAIAARDRSKKRKNEISPAPVAPTSSAKLVQAPAIRDLKEPKERKKSAREREESDEERPNSDDQPETASSSSRANRFKRMPTEPLILRE